MDAFSLEGINRSNAVVNFNEDDPFDPKALWLNAETIRTHAGGRTRGATAALRAGAGFDVDRRQDAADHTAHPGAHQAAARRR